jgi:hypothetical protein
MRLYWRGCGCNNKLPWDPVAAAITPGVDRVQIPGADPRPYFLVEARPRKCRGTPDKHRVASFVGVGESQCRCDTALSDILQLRIDTQIFQGIALPETKE